MSDLSVIPTLTWIVSGTEYSVDDGVYCYLLGHDGMGFPPLERQTDRGPLQHGVTDRGYRLDPRNILLSIAIIGNSFQDFHAKRTALISMFQPRTSPGFLRWTLGSMVRQIDGHVIEGLYFNQEDRNFLTQRASVAIECADPVWYDPVAVSESFALGGGADTDEVPSEVPSVVGASTLNITRAITYPGNWLSYPRIIIHGPITDAVITHEQTGYKLDFTGITISSGEYYEIDLEENSIVDQDGVNKIADLSTDSDLAEFAILPAPDVSGGINTFSITGTSVDASTDIEIIFYKRYLGI